jgi:Patatin-like phospholipase
MFKAIAFGGGGVRGALHIGGLLALEKVRGNLLFPNGVYGSSIGSIVATAVAHNLTATQIQTIFEEHFHLNKVVPSLRLSSLQSMFQRKGLFSMDLLEDTLIQAFLSQGIDLREKPISSSPQKLYIFATNLTTCKPTLFSGDVPILKAILCSCCLPFVFQPQVLFNNIYVDGGVSVQYLDEVVPHDCLVFHISKQAQPLFVSKLESISVFEYFGHLYETGRKSYTRSNTIWFENNDIEILQNLTPELRKKLVDQGYSQALVFLTKRVSQEVEQGIHGSGANVIV